MANYNRKGPKSTRAGCLMCKQHKDQAFKDTKNATKYSVRKAMRRGADGW